MTEGSLVYVVADDQLKDSLPRLSSARVVSVGPKMVVVEYDRRDRWLWNFRTRFPRSLLSVTGLEAWKVYCLAERERFETARQEYHLSERRLRTAEQRLGEYEARASTD